MEDAREWVEYTNESANTYWAQQRRKNGRDKPWGVKIWGLGNEIDGPWQLGHKNAEDYATFALEAAKAMRREDGSIKLIACGLLELPPGADWIGWNRTVLERLQERDRLHLAAHLRRQPRRTTSRSSWPSAGTSTTASRSSRARSRRRGSAGRTPAPSPSRSTSGTSGTARSFPE